VEGQTLDDSEWTSTGVMVRGTSGPDGAPAHPQEPPQPEKSIEDICDLLAAAGEQWDFTSALRLLEGPIAQISEAALVDLRVNLLNAEVLFRAGDWVHLVPTQSSDIDVLRQAWLRLVDVPEAEPRFSGKPGDNPRWKNDHDLWSRHRDFSRWVAHVLGLKTHGNKETDARLRAALARTLESLQWGVPAALTIARFVALGRACAMAESAREEAGPYSMLSMLFGLRAIEAACSAFAQHRGVVRDQFCLESLRVDDVTPISRILGEWKRLGGKLDSRQLSFAEILRAAIQCQCRPDSRCGCSVPAVFEQVCSRLPPVPKPILEACTFDSSFKSVIKNLRIQGMRKDRLEEIDMTLMAVCHLRNTSVFTHGFQNPRHDACSFLLHVAEVLASAIFDGAWREEERFSRSRGIADERDCRPTFEGTVGWMAETLTTARSKLKAFRGWQGVSNASLSGNVIASGIGSTG
jgi:hypothetical protein